MATPIDDIDVGDVIAVSELKDMPDARGEFSGAPHVVMAISLPFLALNDGERIVSLDVRRWGVQKLSTQFVEVMTNRTMLRSSTPIDPYACKQCGDRYVEKMTNEKKPRWRWWCRSCHHDGGPANKAPNGIKQ